MSTPKKFVVFTATGEQGSSVCKYLLEEGYHVVGLTRNPESEKAKALVELGVETVKANLDDPTSYAPALEGLYGAFVNADFWARYFSNGLDGIEAGEYEAGQSKAAIAACVEAGAKHIVYSALDDTYVPHQGYKNKVAQWAAARDYPVTSLYTSNYLSNLTKFDLLRKEADGSFTLAIPAPDDCPVSSYAVEQTGGWVAAIIRDPKKYLRAPRVEACSEDFTVREWADLLTNISGKQVKTLGIPGRESYLEGTEVKKTVVEELYLHYRALYQGLLPRDVRKSAELYPDQWDTRAWVQHNKEIRDFLGI